MCGGFSPTPAVSGQTRRTLLLCLEWCGDNNGLPKNQPVTCLTDVVLFSRKEPPKENNMPGQLPQHVTKKEIEKQAKPGETYVQAADRIKGLKAALKSKV